MSTNLVSEAIVVEAISLIGQGYLAVFGIEDKASGMEMGVFAWSLTNETSGSTHVPNDANLAKLRCKKRDKCLAERLEPVRANGTAPHEGHGVAAGD